MNSKITRRQLLSSAARLGVSYLAFEAAMKGVGLVDQHLTWDQAARSNEEFMAGNGRRLETLALGGSFAPEQWSGRERRQGQALTGLDLAVRDLNLRQMRLGLRWSRVQQEDGSINLAYYRDYLNYAFSSKVDVCLNIGPIRVFRWPEDHVPPFVLDALPAIPPKRSEVRPGTPLADASIEYLDRVMDTLKHEYSAEDLRAIKTIQVENEPFYLMGENEWRVSPEHVLTATDRVHAAFPDANILITSAGRLNMNAIRDVFAQLLSFDHSYRGKLISGFDFHYRTPSRDSYPVIRYFDQITYARPLVAGTNDNIVDSRRVGYRIEVTEGQMEPYGQFEQPGNSATDLRYMLQRVLDHVLDPEQPGLVRLWGVEELVKKMAQGDLTDEHRQIIELIQGINDRSSRVVGGTR